MSLFKGIKKKIIPFYRSARIHNNPGVLFQCVFKFMMNNSSPANKVENGAVH